MRRSHESLLPTLVARCGQRDLEVDYTRVRHSISVILAIKVAVYFASPPTPATHDAARKCIGIEPMVIGHNSVASETIELVL